MKNLFALATLSSLLVYLPNAEASIVNGDFATCDFSGWQQDTDGLGAPGNTADFTIANDAGNCSANIMVDDMTTSTAFYANTLFTGLDLSASENDLTLSFDWTFSGTDGDAQAGDYFSVYLSDGSGAPFNAQGMPGYLIDPVSSYGSDSFTAVLDSSLYTMSNWTLEFQLFDAFSPTDEPLMSVLNIDNVQLTAQAVAVSAPATGILASLCTLAALRRRTNKPAAQE
ncbi:hypothetical protein [Salinimonas chungwhensis]|uniref:hypothetical protein n=1 Tax=Salinimonas chungwhensis TaxID=265425 RepID=UPI00037EFFBD|nr:hypothetical protein [Salinimonas chungwhensis]